MELPWVVVGSNELSCLFIDLVMKCVTSVSYAVLVNGYPSKVFNPSRGLRQGDPLSPFLFILCAQGFSSMLKRAERQGKMKGIKFGAEGPSLPHLLFALALCESSSCRYFQYGATSYLSSRAPLAVKVRTSID